MADDAREPADEATNVLLIEGVELTKTDALDQLCHRLTGWGAVVSLEVLADKRSATNRTFDVQSPLAPHASMCAIV